jgi:hypothetical protein
MGFAPLHPSHEFLQCELGKDPRSPTPCAIFKGLDLYREYTLAQETIESEAEKKKAGSQAARQRHPATCVLGSGIPDDSALSSAIYVVYNQ